MKYSIPKGVFDIIPHEPLAEDQWRNSDRWEYVESVLRKSAHDYGFKEIRTPIFENTDLFVRGVGESSDIVTKEMYTFLDKGERSLTLRPEGTASSMRAYVEKNLDQQPGSQKLFYIGPMFRYERPQAGRYRQHHQFGAEAIGNSKPEQDAEMIDMLCEIYRRLGLKELHVMINSVGDAASRDKFREALTSYLKPHFDQLSADSQVRFSKNILRILDSKDPADQKILAGAPSLLDSLTTESKDHFNKVLKLLDGIGLSYTVTPKLVRGLDYYDKTVFEVASLALGAQNSIGGGGRYDGLLKALGGPSLPAVGYAMGIERVLQTMAKQEVAFPPPPHPEIFIIALGDASREYCFTLLCQLRHAGIRAEMDLMGKKVGTALQLADTLGAEYSLVIGDEELSSQKIKLKNMKSRESIDLTLASLLETLKTFKAKN